MKPSVDPRFILAYRLSTCKKESIFILILLGALLSFGFLISPDQNQNFDMIYQFADRDMWGFFFGVYTLGNLLYYSGNLNKHLAATINTAGLFAWNYIMLSFVFYDPHIAPTEFLFLGVVLVQMWVLLLIINKD